MTAFVSRTIMPHTRIDDMTADMILVLVGWIIGPRAMDGTKRSMDNVAYSSFHVAYTIEWMMISSQLLGARLRIVSGRYQMSAFQNNTHHRFQLSDTNVAVLMYKAFLMTKLHTIPGFSIKQHLSGHVSVYSISDVVVHITSKEVAESYLPSHWFTEDMS